MAYFILVLFLVAIIHFIYESLVAPTLRLKLRYELYALRDELRLIKFQHKAEELDDVFKFLHGSINNLTKVLYSIDIETVCQTKRALKYDKSFAARVEKRLALLENCKIQEVHAMRRKINLIIGLAIMVNSGAWFIYVLPIVIVALSCGVIKQLIKRIVVIPESEIGKIAPSCQFDHVAAC